jgi:hypothetical protein
MKAKEFIQIISKIQWSKLSREDSQKLTSDDGFSLSYSVDLHTHKSLPPVQIIARLCYMGTLVMNWGFEDNESMREFIALWKQAKSNTYDLSEGRDKVNKALAKKILENL